MKRRAIRATLFGSIGFVAGGSIALTLGVVFAAGASAGATLGAVLADCRENLSCWLLFAFGGVLVGGAAVQTVLQRR